MNTFEKFKFDGDPRDPEYWWDIISLKYQGYDPKEDGMISVPVEQLEELQQSYVKTINALGEVAGTTTKADIARECLKEIRNH